MRVLFVWTDVGTTIPQTSTHTGIGCLSALLKQAGHETSLLRIADILDEECFLRLYEQETVPDMIAFSVTTNQFPYCIRLADILKAHYDIPIIFGGVHATLVPEEVIAQKSVDVLCRGEGDQAMVEIANCIEHGEDYSDIGNLWVKKDGEIKRNPIRPIDYDINDLPPMDLEIFKLEELFKDYDGIELQPMAGRGCPYQCTYCCNPSLNRLYKGKGQAVRTRSIETVIAEIKHNIAKYPKINRLAFQDETFTKNKQWVRDFCKVYKEEIGIEFSALARINTLDKAMIDTLKDAGCYMMRIGIESGNEWMREHVLNRKMSNEKIIEVYDYAEKIGMCTYAYAMFGLPYETPEMIEETIALVRRINPNFVQLSVFYPYPGTQLYEECKSNGWLTGEDSMTYFERSVLNQPSISNERLMEYYLSFRQELVEMAAKKEGRGYYDFITNIDTAEVETANDDFVRPTTFFASYPETYWLQAHPPTEITYEVELRKNSRLIFDLAKNPDTYQEEGDGVKFEIAVNGKKIFSNALNPKKKKKDRGWFRHELSLKKEGLSRITFATHSLAKSNNYFCTAGWGRPHLESPDDGK